MKQKYFLRYILLPQLLSMPIFLIPALLFNNALIFWISPTLTWALFLFYVLESKYPIEKFK